MPLVLTENELTESGIRYADVTGVRYQYPKHAYKNIITSGDRFVYYRGRRSRTGKRIPQVYFGAGVIGDIRDDPGDPSRLHCEVLDYVSFPDPVPFKEGSAGYLERDGSRPGYFQRGVRKISESEFSRILTLAGTRAENQTAQPSTDVGYATADAIRDVDRFAVDTAMELLAARYPGGKFAKQPHNNPGFDILVEDRGQSLFVEVKGTRSTEPRFLITNGELMFSRRHSQDYVMCIIYHIDLEAGGYRVSWHTGPVEEPVFDLRAIQWRGVLRDAE